jgi:hypothetical protein
MKPSGSRSRASSKPTYPPSVEKYLKLADAALTPVRKQARSAQKDNKRTRRSA